MTSVDELFKKSGVLPSKRKLEPPVRDPTQAYKHARTSNGTSSRHAQVEEGDGGDDTEAGPSAPPDGGEDEGDYGPPAPAEDEPDDDDDDEDGRFFGGGITAQQSTYLDYVNDDGLDPDAPLREEKIDAAWLKKTALKFEQRINKNAAQRAKYESDPAKFIQSEADLDADIKMLSILGEHPELYPTLVGLGTVGSLVGLLAHENTDIAIGAIEIIGELTDEDVAAEEEQWNALVDALLGADLVGLLVSNLGRLNEDAGDGDDADRAGVYHALGVVEHLCSQAATAEKIAKDEGLIKWLLGRIQKKERPITQNRQYAAEILAILVQSSALNRRRVAGVDGVDIMLQLVASYRKIDPEKGEEEEYMENLFEALTCIVDEAEGKTKFVEAEGLELCLIMLKEGKLSKFAALRLLDHAVGGTSGTEVCQKLVEAGGLKTMFTMFMKKNIDNGTTEHLVGILASMLRLLPAGSAERIRLLAKFVEKNYEKLERLVVFRRDYAARLRLVDEQMLKEQQRKGVDEEDAGIFEDERFLRRLEGGLFTLRSIDMDLAWLIAEDDGARTKIQELLAEKNETFAVIKSSLQEQLDGIDDEKTEDSKDTRDMLTTLIEFL